MKTRTFLTHKKAAAAAIVTAALFVLAAVIFLTVSAGNRDTLVIRNAETGKIYARYDCPDGTRFEVEFLHSVNKSPVIDVFEASEGIIRVAEARYYTFGAGMPTEADQPTWEFSYADDGAIVVTGITYTYDRLNYIVGTVHDHYLTIHGERINLRELCGRNAKIEIYQQK